MWWWPTNSSVTNTFHDERMGDVSGIQGLTNAHCESQHDGQTTLKQPPTCKLLTLSISVDLCIHLASCYLPIQNWLHLHQKHERLAHAANWSLKWLMPLCWHQELPLQVVEDLHLLLTPPHLCPAHQTSLGSLPMLMKSWVCAQHRISFPLWSAKAMGWIYLVKFQIQIWQISEFPLETSSGTKKVVKDGGRRKRGISLTTLRQISSPQNLHTSTRSQRNMKMTTQLGMSTSIPMVVVSEIVDLPWCKEVRALMTAAQLTSMRPWNRWCLSLLVSQLLCMGIWKRVWTIGSSPTVLHKVIHIIS